MIQGVGETFKMTYCDSANQESDRVITIMNVEKDDANIDIIAHCHLRNETRSFRVDRIIGDMVNMANGKAVSPVEICGDIMDEAVALKIALSGVQKEIKALKFFAKVIRDKFSKKERAPIISFIRSNTNTHNFSDEAIDEWLCQLWCGDAYGYKLDGDMTEYRTLINGIKTERMADCRDVAVEIARGSGRRLISPELLARINSDFSN